MNTLTLHNSLGGEKVPFTPIKPGHIGLYVCGVTVYDYCHIGHARLLIVFDVIVKYLRSQGWQVTYVRNITDVDDKIINRALENNEPFLDLANRFIKIMHEDEATLNIARPDHEPRATEHMHNIIDMISTLESKGFTYKTPEGDVYYRVKEFADYGKLSNNTLEGLREGASVRDSRGSDKEDAHDFALWKASDDLENSWDSPWGHGRPGWHIECSAMSKSCLGVQFDLHGGGIDLRFPHHENEIAQSEAAHDCQMANYWLHAGAVRVDGEKMSKSLNNFFTIREVLAHYHPEVVRFFSISSHYRSPINYSEENLQEALSGLSRFYHTLKPFKGLVANVDVDCEFYQRFVAAMNDDFNSRQALAAMFDLANRINQLKESEPDFAQHLANGLLAMGDILGILQEDPSAFLQAGASLTDEEVQAKIAERQAAKDNKDYAGADAIRAALKEQGIILEDSREGTTWRRAE